MSGFSGDRLTPITRCAGSSSSRSMKSCPENELLPMTTLVAGSDMAARGALSMRPMRHDRHVWRSGDPLPRLI